MARGSRRHGQARVCTCDCGTHPGANPAERLIATLTDSNFRIRSLIVAERKTMQNRAPVYMYAFNWETPLFDGNLLRAGVMTSAASLSISISHLKSCFGSSNWAVRRSL